MRILILVVALLLVGCATKQDAKNVWTSIENPSYGGSLPRAEAKSIIGDYKVIGSDPTREAYIVERVGTGHRETFSPDFIGLLSRKSDTDIWDKHPLVGVGDIVRVTFREPTKEYVENMPGVLFSKQRKYYFLHIELVKPSQR